MKIFRSNSAVSLSNWWKHMWIHTCCTSIWCRRLLLGRIQNQIGWTWLWCPSMEADLKDARFLNGDSIIHPGSMFQSVCCQTICRGSEGKTLQVSTPLRLKEIVVDAGYRSHFLQLLTTYGCIILSCCILTGLSWDEPTEVARIEINWKILWKICDLRMAGAGQNLRHRII